MAYNSQSCIYFKDKSKLAVASMEGLGQICNNN